MLKAQKCPRAWLAAWFWAIALAKAWGSLCAVTSGAEPSSRDCLSRTVQRSCLRMCAVCLLPHDSVLSASRTAVQLHVSASRKQGAGREGERCVLHVSSGAQIAKMASTKGSASAGIRKAATETSPSTWEWMCCNMRGQSAMPHPQRIAVKLGRSLGMSALAWVEIIVERLHQSSTSVPLK